MNTVLQVGSLAEVLAYIATSLGFQPADSLVAVSVRPPRSRIGLVTRVDLDAAPESPDHAQAGKDAAPASTLEETEHILVDYIGLFNAESNATVARHLPPGTTRDASRQ